MDGRSTTAHDFPLVYSRALAFFVPSKHPDLAAIGSVPKVDGLGDDEVLTKLEALEADGILPLFWIAGGFIVRHIFLARLVASF